MNSKCSSRFRFHLSLFLFPTLFLSTHTTDTIAISQILSDTRDDTIISPAGAFVLGFFSPSGSKNRYVGIWYNIKLKTVVWVANKDNPLTDRLGRLKIVEPGRLLVLNATNATIWSANTSSSVQTPIAQLLDSGNLVLTDANDESGENIIWQSFDYPTDTSLPGMKLGWNFKTGHEVYLTSATNAENLASGDITYHCDPSGYPQTVIKEGDSVRYKTGPWNGFTFSGSQNLMKNTIFTFGMVIDKDQVYFQFELLNDSVFMRFQLSESGVGQRWLWSPQTENWILYLTIPNDSCDIYEGCGPYGFCNTKRTPECSCLDKFKPNDPNGWENGDFSNGCTRRTLLNCRRDVFLKYSGVKLPDTERSWYNKSMTLRECRVACLANCSCTAYAPLNISNGENGCLLWFGDLVDMRGMSPGQDVYIRMAASELDSENKKQKVVGVTLSMVIGMLLLSLSMLLYIHKRKKLNRRNQQETERLRQTCGDNNRSEESHEELELPMFELSTVIKATDDFSIDNKLGEGGFGSVYKGVLGEEKEIAVKRLSKTSLQGVDEFKNEVICIAKLQHRNLVKLLACCIHGEEIMLIYEYMTNRSLDLILFDQVKSKILDWPRRFNIINGIARGLMYLHHDSRLRVIHRDLKASNILLDSDMNPKISDFGLAKTFGGNETGSNTRRVVGTYGYMSPEYAGEGMFSVKSDVFSFGVLVLEAISGKRNRGFSHGDQRYNLLGYAWVLYKEGRELELVDSSVEYSSYLPQVFRSIHVGLLCVQERPEDRPNMSSVVFMLNNDGVLPQAKYPGFFIGKDTIRPEISGSSNTTSSANAMTISLLEAR